MGKVKKLYMAVATIMLTLGISFGGSAAFAEPAQAYSAWHYNVVYCDWTYTYYKVDYNWWEETFQGKRDYEFLSKVTYRYNPVCHGITFR